MSFVALFVTLPTRAGTGRTRALRALRAMGCATLRDGVHLLPESGERAAAMEAVAAEVRAAGGSGEVFRLEGRDARQTDDLCALFDRTADHAELAEEIRRFRAEMEKGEPAALARRLSGLAQRLDRLAAIDFFPGEAGRQARSALDEARRAADALLSPGEPRAVADGAALRLATADHRGRTWATRRHLGIDRMASAWLIRRRIDPEARFVWFDTPAGCRPEWLGFDFDGAAFTHVGGRVTFETLLAAFGLDADPALARLGELVHVLDVGGLPVPEAPGIEAVLAGFRQSAPDDDHLVDLATPVFDGLLTAFAQGASP